MYKTRILIVDDEPSIIRFIREDLEVAGYEVLVAMDGAEGLKTFKSELPDLVILDIRMPKMDGFELCRRIRQWSQTPIIMLTALDSSEDIVKALDLGADDYIIKDYSKSELMARVKAVLRRATLWEECSEPTLRAYELAIDFLKHRVTLGEQEVNLTATEYRLLSHLARNSDRVISPDQILEAVWGENYVGEHHILRVNIGRLRHKLRDDSKEPRFIATKTGIGYIFLKPD
ncbi:response regulator transcription factor [Chloroflexota bacterium]